MGSTEDLARDLYNEYHFPRPNIPWHYLDFNTKNKWRQVAKYALIAIRTNDDRTTNDSTPST